MQTKVQRWGNSLGIRIPKSFAAQSGMTVDSSIEVTIEGEVISLRPIKTPIYSLEELLLGVTPKNRHHEISFGEAEGNEVW